MGLLELAELLKWPAIIAGALGLVMLIRKWIMSSGADKRDLEQVEEASKERGKASEDIRKRSGVLGNLWRAARLRSRPKP